MLKKVSGYCLAISIYFLTFFIVSTYAKYSTQFDNNANFNLTKWKILINNSDIMENSDISELITPTFETNEYIAENVIAPTSSGYFDIELDSSNTNLSFSYLISIAKTTEVNDFIVTGYSINNSETILPFDDHISGEILYDANIDLTSFRIYVEWIDGDGQTSNNIEDTVLGNNESIGAFQVSIQLNQIEDDYTF